MLKRLPFAAALSLAALFPAALPAAARDIIAVAPVYSQLVAFAAPAGFKAVYEAEQNGSYILELVPKGESPEAWTQMLTLTGIKGGADRQSAVDFAAGLASGYQAACPDTFSARNLPAPRIKGVAQTFAGYVGCGAVQGRSEEMVFVILQGAVDLYTLQWAARGPALAGPISPDAPTWMPRADALALTRICDKVAGEQAPYPSCTQ